MAPDPSSSGAAWHATLAEHDAKAHNRMAEFADTTEFELLRRRLDALNAEVIALRAAVDWRSKLLRERSMAIAERDARIRMMELALRDRAGWIAVPLRGLRRTRSAVARALRRGPRRP